MDANIDSFMSLEENLATYRIQLSKFAHVVQYNKRDLPDAVPVEQMRKELNLYNVPDFDAVAIQGQGVFETLRTLVRMVADKVVLDLGL